MGIKVAMLVVAIMALFATATSAFFIGRPFIANWISGPERERERDAEIDRLEDEIKNLKDEIKNLIELNRETLKQLDDLRHQQQDSEYRLQIQEMKLEYDRKVEQLQRTAAERQRRIAELERRQRDLQRKLEPMSKQNETHPLNTDPVSPTVSVREMKRYDVTFRGTWVESDRSYYRARFADGCNVPASTITNTRQGFVFFSTWCDAATFGGFEFVQAPSARVGAASADGSR
jgi:hypothetical protein